LNRGPQLADAVGRKIAALKDQAMPGGFPQLILVRQNKKSLILNFRE